MAQTCTIPRARWLLAALMASLLGGCVTPKRFGGPAPFRNQHPAQLTALCMDPRQAQVLADGQSQLRLDTAYTSIFLDDSSGTNTWHMDGEILRTGLKFRYGLGNGLEIQTELAMAVTGPGFLDSFIESWHDAFGLPDQNRDDFPRNKWRVDATKGGTKAWEMDRTESLLDMPVVIAWNFLPMTEQRPWALTVRAGTEIPTGNQERGFGSGGFDWSVGMVGEYQHGPFSFTGHLQHAFVHTPGQAAAGLDFHDVTSAGVGVEAALAEHTALLVQVLFETSTLRELHIDAASDPQWTLWFGLRHRLGPRFSVEAGFGEDLDPDVPPDFTAWLGFVFDLGGSGD